jgi:hypothetical protein
MNKSMLRAIIGTRADTSSSKPRAIPDYSAILSRNTAAKIPSHTARFADTSKPEPKTYTGNAVIGIATLHKSNAVPVFSKEEACAISEMRRSN